MNIFYNFENNNEFIAFQNTEKCPQCGEQGQTYFLRYFYLSLEEAIYKCGNSHCLYPNHHFVFKNLKDKTVYYYQEVEDGTNDIMLKVSMDGQNKYSSANPMRTELFSESQRNPDIESYDFDLFDFLADNDTPAPSSSNIVPEPSDDYLDFLNEIPNTSTNANESNLGKSGVDSFIENLLEIDTTSTSNIWPNQQGKTEKVTLSKCMEHIERVKGRKKVKEEKPQETFLQKVRKTKATQSTANKKQTMTEKVNTIVSSAQNLRPTQFVNQLKLLDLKNSNSSFLRTLAKIKQDNENGASSKISEVRDKSIDAPSIAEPVKLAQTKRKRSTTKEKKELKVNKKEPKPRKTPVRRSAKQVATATVVKTEPVDNKLTEPVVAENDMSLGIPIAIDLSRISVPEMNGKALSTPKILTKRSRRKKTEVELPKPKKIKNEQLDGSMAESPTTTNIQNDIPIIKGTEDNVIFN